MADNSVPQRITHQAVLRGSVNRIRKEIQKSVPLGTGAAPLAIRQKARDHALDLIDRLYALATSGNVQPSTVVRAISLMLRYAIPTANQTVVSNREFVAAVASVTAKHITDRAVFEAWWNDIKQALGEVEAGIQDKENSYLDIIEGAESVEASKILMEDVEMNMEEAADALQDEIAEMFDEFGRR